MTVQELAFHVNHLLILAYSPDENDLDAFISEFLEADTEVQDTVSYLIGNTKPEPVN